MLKDGSCKSAVCRSVEDGGPYGLPYFTIYQWYTCVQTISFGSERCVSWDFEANGGEGDWTTEGCETIGLVDGVVTCQCNHLTNFAILVV